MKRWLPALFLLPISVGAFAADAGWPDLPKTCFVKGRPSTAADVKAGCAVFVAATPEGKVIGKPLNVEIPQYAIVTDTETGKKTHVILIQAEEAKGIKLAGYKIAGTDAMVADLLDSLKLLGQKKPD